MVRKFENLRVWQDAMNLVEKVFEASGKFPNSEIYGLTSQIRRAVVSVPSNISEGCGKKTDKDFVKYLYNALGSTKEVRCQLMIAERLKFLGKEEDCDLIDEVDNLGAMLMNFIRKVENED